MSSVLNTLMVLCVMGLLGVMMGVEAVPHPLHERSGRKSQGPLHIQRKRTRHGGAEAETVPLFLDPSAMVPTIPIKPIHEHSISPWTYNNSYHKDLFPDRISEASCSLQGCRDKEGREDLELESKPILHQILVLRRVGGAGPGGFHYRLETKVISVGCTCITPSIQHQL